MSELLRVLMLEDRAPDAKLNERELRKAGIKFTALRVETEKEFRTQLLAFRPGLILADFALPTWDGRSALAVAQAQCPEVPFVVVTETLGEETAVEMILAGASDFILKQRVDRLGGAVLRALRSADDKKELNLAERRLRDSEVRYRGLFEGASAGILIVDVETGMIVDANPFLCNLLGVSLQQLLGKQASEVDCLNAIGGHLSVSPSQPATSTTSADMFVTTHDGRHLDVAVSSSVRIVNGRHLIQCDIRDITDRKRLAEVARSVLQTAMDGVWVVDLEGRFLKVNAAYCTMSGYTRDELHTMRISDVEAAETAAETVAHVAVVVRDGSARFESRHRRKDGTVFDVEVSATCPRGGGGRIFAFLRDLTTRNEMQALVALKTFSIDAQSDAMFWMTEEGRIHDVNAAACRSLGYTKVELLGRMVGDLDDRWDAAAWAKQFSELRQRGSLRFEYEQLHRDGHRTPMEVTANYVKFGDLELNASTVRDVSVRKKAEEALRSSEARYRAAIDSANDAVLTIDSSGVIVHWNRSAERIFGLSEGEAIGQPVTAIIPSRFHAGHAAGLARVLSSDERRVIGSTAELAGHHKDGHEFPMELSLAEWETAGGRFFTGVIRDISERKAAEADLRLRGSALQAAANPIVITDRTGAIVWANAAFSTESGYQLNEAVGKNPRDLVKSGAHDQPFYKELWDTILAGKVWQGEMTNRRKDGTLYPEDVTITPVKNAEGEVAHFVAVKRNLTEEKGLRAQFLQAQKMESVGRLAAGVAHDFNNLLTVINGTADLAAMGLGDGDPLRADLEEIRKAGDRAAALTRQLLAFSRKQIMTPVVLNLGMVVEDLRSMLSRLIGEDVVLVVASANNVGNVLADPGQMEQVLVNMAVNARDAMPGGGTLTITVEDVELDEDFAATHQTVTAGRYVMLAVSDTGTGMSEEIRAMIFEPFFTTKGLGKGTGLGLSTVYGIVKQTGGSIWVDSDIGKGTTFTIYLPRVEAEVQQYQLRRSSVPVPGTETILIVEDEDALRDLARRIMELAGYRVLTAAGGVEAVQLLERLDGPVHLMLTDVVMPGISGPELAALVADSHPHMKVLFTSGYTDDAVLIRGILDQMTNFIKKPYEVATLTAKVREVLDSQDSQPTAGNGDREVVHSSQ